MAVKLNLPPPPEHLIIKLKQTLDDKNKIEDDHYRVWANEYHNLGNSVRHHYYMPEELSNELNDLYVPYFKQKIIPLLVVMHSFDSRPATLTPHCDSKRFTAINYFIELGGDAVYTYFYDYVRESIDIDQAVNLKSDEIKLVKKVKFEKDMWYGFNVQQCHSVENITTTRIFLALILENNQTFDEFCKVYSNLIIG